MARTLMTLACLIVPVSAGPDPLPSELEPRRVSLQKDRPLSQVPTFHAGLFRINLKRVALAQQLEDDTHTCHLDLAVAWEPRLRPYYLDVGPLSATFADADKKTHTSHAPG